MNDNKIDQLAMLLSTDWFAEEWPLLGIHSDRSRCRQMQRRCRPIVDDLFNGADDYWQVSFEPQRINRTREKFFSAAKESALDSEDLECLKRLLDDTALETNEASLLQNLTLLLNANPDQEILRDLPQALASKVASILGKVETMPDLKSELNASTTPWDMEMRKRTPGLPEYLADFAIGLCSKRSFFEKFWAHAAKEISQEEKDKLLAWYRLMAHELAGFQIHLR